MTRDYRRGAPPPKPKRREPKPCFFWFVLGGLLGGSAVGLAWSTKTQPPGVQEGTPARVVPSEASRPKFDFYDILPEMEVVVSEEEMSRPTAPPTRPGVVPPATPGRPLTQVPPPLAPAEPTPPATGGAYLLQVASFRRPADAERLRERLAALGIQAQIQTVTINNKDTYHRVRTGPLSGREQANQVRELLKRQGLESIAIKVQ